MKKINLITFIFIGLFAVFSYSNVAAQDENPSTNSQSQDFDETKRPNLLAELDLSKEQIQQIRRINREKQPFRRAAQKRLEEAKRNLDQAIYADVTSETEVQSRLKEVQIAQAEVFKIRSMTEYAVRKILTAEQLSKFREIRRQFMERLDNRQNLRRNRQLNNLRNGNPSRRLP